GGSKLFFNRLLEMNPAPVIWTSNELHDIDPAVVRRMTVALELRAPPRRQRRRIIEGLSKRYGVEMNDDELDQLALKLDATPAILENAIKAVGLAGGNAAQVERIGLNVMRAVSGGQVKSPPLVALFDPNLVCSNIDLLRLTGQLKAKGSRNFSLCMSGPPGTGKSAFARHLASELGLEVIQKRASDLLGPFVGQSEQNIAIAFQEARELKALLIFDEADSLLLERQGAQHSWEITQVNEMLTWMEEHPFPVCFTTNLMDRIDTASLRRFTFDIRFDYLDRAAIKRAWSIFFQINDPPADGLMFANLTPGDFTKARKQAQVLGLIDKPAELVTILSEIARTKPGQRGGLGFGI
ncbi:MAG: ATP-binding protein, partial [Pseudomonadota bacterium]